MQTRSFGSVVIGEDSLVLADGPCLERCVHDAIVEHARRAPDAPALSSDGLQLSYGELEQRSDRFATFLRRMGVTRDQRVGVCMERSHDVMVAVLGIHKAGAAYVPLDPSAKRERLQLMIERSGAQVLVTQRHLLADLPTWRTRNVCIDADWPEIEKLAPEAIEDGARPESLAYAAFTADCNGELQPLQVEHRRAASALLGKPLPAELESSRAWVAANAVPFDVAVLEMLWALSHGMHVSLAGSRERPPVQPSKPPAAEVVRKPLRPVDFSVFLWGSDDRESTHKYRLMLDAARFADSHGFVAVWTPERHFHAFGGPYPNPSVTGAAIAATTSRVQVRAGSCVVPLHHPARIAEEWAVVDNLSQGRVGIGFASGWQPDDFLLRPESYPDFKRAMSDSIDTVRKLWRGEPVKFRGGLGNEVAIVTQPRPVQHELPFWITSAGNPDTYRLAGQLGGNVLTHLLGQSLGEVEDKIRIYREARAQAGFDPATGVVSLMLHTFVGRDVDEVRALVREPLKAYLASAVALVKSYAWSFPAFKRPKGEEAKPQDIDLGSLTPEETDAILEFAFERYFNESGLFGTAESVQDMIDDCRDAGVDDVACLIDFGVPTETVLGALPHLDRARQLAQARTHALVTV